MPSFFSKIKGALSSSPATPRRNASQQPQSGRSPSGATATLAASVTRSASAGPSTTSSQQSFVKQQVYVVKDKDLPKLHSAAWRGDLDKVTELCRPDKLNQLDREGRTPLHLAIAANQMKIVEQLLQEDAKYQLDRDSRSPLVVAAIIGNPKMMQLLLSYMGDNQKNTIVNLKDKTGLNPLLYAVKYDNMAMIQTLLKERAIDIDFQDLNNDTSLHYAVILKKYDIIELLIESSANLDLQNRDGKTPLMLAAQTGDEELTDFLLDYGPDKTLKDNRGNTAFDLAMKSRNPKCSDVIKRDRPIKPNPDKLARAKQNIKDTTSVTETTAPSSDGLKKFENMFMAGGAAAAAASGQQQLQSSKYTDQDTSKVSVISNQDVRKEAKSESKLESWMDDSDEDQDDEIGSPRKSVPDLTKGASKEDLFDSLFKSGNDSKAKKPSETDIDIDLNKDRLHSTNVAENESWLFETGGSQFFPSVVNKSQSSNQVVLSSFQPDLNKSNKSTKLVRKDSTNSWGSTEDDSLLVNSVKKPPANTTVISNKSMNQINEEKVSTFLGKKPSAPEKGKGQGPPEISDFENNNSIDSDSFDEPGPSFTVAKPKDNSHLFQVKPADPVKKPTADKNDPDSLRDFLDEIINDSPRTKQQQKQQPQQSSVVKSLVFESLPDGGKKNLKSKKLDPDSIEILDKSKTDSIDDLNSEFSNLLNPKKNETVKQLVVSNMTPAALLNKSEPPSLSLITESLPPPGFRNNDIIDIDILKDNKKGGNTGDSFRLPNKDDAPSLSELLKTEPVASPRGQKNKQNNQEKKPESLTLMDMFRFDAKQKQPKTDSTKRDELSSMSDSLTTTLESKNQTKPFDVSKQLFDNNNRQDSLSEKIDKQQKAVNDLNQSKNKVTRTSSLYDDDPFVDSDEDIENAVLPNKSNNDSNLSAGKISTGVGTLVKKVNVVESNGSAFRNDERQRTGSFIDIMPELIESSKNNNNVVSTSMASSVNQLNQAERVELELKIKVLEMQKKNLETAFNSADRTLAEKEKQINEMTNEKYKAETSYKNAMDELIEQISGLKESKASLEAKINILEHQKSQIKTPRLSVSEYDETLKNQMETYMNKCKAQEKLIEDLTEDRKKLSIEKERLTNEIEEHMRAIEIVTANSNTEKNALNDQLNKSKNELKELMEARRQLGNEIDQLKHQLNEKNLNYEKINMEKSSFEQQMSREKQDVDKLKASYDAELNRMREDKMKTMEKLALVEAKLISNEKEVELAKAQIQEREKQIEDLRSQLAQAKTDFALQLNILKKEKEEKESLLRKCEQLEDSVRKNMDHINDLKLNSARLSERGDKSAMSFYSWRKQDGDVSSRKPSVNQADDLESTRKMEKLNNKLQNDVKTLAEKLEKTENKVETMRSNMGTATAIVNSPRGVKRGNGSISANPLLLEQLPGDEDTVLMMSTRSRSQSPRKGLTTDVDKLRLEIQKLRDDFNFVIDKYSSLEQNNSQLAMNLNSLKMQTLHNANEAYKRQPVDVASLITDSSLRNIATLNNYLLNGVNPRPQQAIDLNQSRGSLNNSLDHSHHHHHHDHHDKSTSSMKWSCPKCSNSYVDMLKDEMARRIDVQVARDSPISNLDYTTRKFINTSRLVDEIANQISLSSTDKFDSLYNKMLLNHKYSTNNNVDLLNSMRTRFLI